LSAEQRNRCGIPRFHGIFCLLSSGWTTYTAADSASTFHFVSSCNVEMTDSSDNENWRMFGSRVSAGRRRLRHSGYRWPLPASPCAGVGGTSPWYKLPFVLDPDVSYTRHLMHIAAQAPGHWPSFLKLLSLSRRWEPSRRLHWSWESDYRGNSKPHAILRKFDSSYEYWGTKEGGNSTGLLTSAGNGHRERLVGSETL
jgi:hypothetical protein